MTGTPPTLVDLVVATLGDGDPDGPLPGPAPTPDDGAWVWRADPPLPSVGSGPLDGVRLGVKDIVAVAGRRRGAGSAQRSGAPPETADAPVVTAMRSAGAVVVGATKLHEFAFGVTGINAVDGTPTNPAAPGRVPGGSSSGSAAAVAAGEADVAIGTDTGGSCRIPAACCAVVGYKPTRGAITTEGVLPLAPSLDHVGWLVRDTTLLGPLADVFRLRAAAPTRPLRRVGVHRGSVDPADEVVVDALVTVVDRLRRSGVEVVDVDWPDAAASFAASTAVMFAEAAHVHRRMLAERPDAYGADVRARLEHGTGIGLVTYLRGRDELERLTHRCRAVLADVDVVIGSTMPIVPPTITEAGDTALAARMVANTRLANLTGLPAVSIPVPGTALPVGVQIEGPDDGTVIAAAELLAGVLAVG